MATVHYCQLSFWHLLWQDIADFNTTLIAIPAGLLSPDSGFAFQNIDGTYTVSLGDDIVMGPGGPVSGTVDQVLRLSSIAGPRTIGSAEVSGSFSAADLYNACRNGGSYFQAAVFSSNDVVHMHEPAGLGALDESPEIETYGGNDTVFGTGFAVYG
jgi:hypothetical protein